MDPIAFTSQLARHTGALLLEYLQSEELERSLKPDHSLVTSADIAADNLISQAIQEEYPNDLVVSEELSPTFIPVEDKEEHPLWIIDPLDGTTNFSLGLRYWGVLITRLFNGLPELTVSYFPEIDELYTAQRGKGAFLNGDRIHVRPPSPDNPLSFFACCSRTFRHYDVSVPYKARILGSAAYSFCSVARGISVVGFEATPKIWDIAGAWLMVEEAGGYITTLDSSLPFPLKPDFDYSRVSFPTLAAASREILRKVQGQILPR